MRKITNLEKAYVFFKTKTKWNNSISKNDIAKQICLADWKCVLDGHTQFTDIEYTYFNKINLSYIYFRINWLDWILGRYRIDEKYKKSFNHILKVTDSGYILNKLFCSFYPSFKYFYDPPETTVKLDFVELAKEYKEIYNRE